MSEAHDAQQLLTTEQAAEIAGVGVRTVRRWVESGRLRAVQRRPQILIDRANLDQFLRERNPPAHAGFTEIEAATGTAHSTELRGGASQPLIGSRLR
jgi:excisionase family DNA binding protein